MSVTYYDIEGTVISPEDCRIPKARDLALKLRSGSIDFARYVECRSRDHIETVVFEVDVEAPQVKKHRIAHVERISAAFADSDSVSPWVQALRKDFPEVPHLNLHLQEFPRSLCLYGERYEEVKRRWTVPRFIHEIRSWLSLTAQGKLHQADQPLEPIIADSATQIVLPQQIWESAAAPERLFVENARGPDKPFFLIAKTQPPPDGNALRMLASVHRTPPRTHGIIRRRPTTLADLDTLLNGSDFDLLSEIRERLKNWHSNNPKILEARLLIIVQIPKRRGDDGDPENVETWAFFLGDPKAQNGESTDIKIRKLGQRIGLWDLNNGQVGLLLQPDLSKNGSDIAMDVLNVSFELTRSLAAGLNGDEQPFDSSIAAVGVGALGSQVVLNLARSGFGRWTLIDNDHVMPHNVVRHALSGHFIGHNKAEALSFIANSIIGQDNLLSAIPSDVFSVLGDDAKLKTTLEESDVILDVSTSVAVSRLLASDIDTNSRRASLFLTPTGQDLVFILEDQDRNYSLDALEMQYYRAAVNDSELEGHFGDSQQRQRYGQSCRDVTSTLPQHLVALHSAIAAQALRKYLLLNESVISIWRADTDGNVSRVSVAPCPAIIQPITEWTLVTDEGLLAKLSTFREQKLPNETGGVLLGSFDVEHSILYIVDALPSPPDSEEWPTLYIRGQKGLRTAVDRIQDVTGGMLEYVGEWHSHPRGCRTSASHDDMEVFSWLTSLMEADGLPAVMMIVGDSGQASCFVGEIKSEENLIQGGLQ